METLKAYISLVEPQLLNHITGKVKDFILTFRDGHYVSEEAFIKEICGENYNRRHYFYLKSSAIKMLQALAMVSRSNGVNSLKKKLDLCRKNFTIGQKFLEQGIRNEGIELIKEAHKLAVQYEFVHLASELSSILYYNHLYYQRNTRKAKIYAAMVNQYAEWYLAEKKIEHYFFPIIGKMGSSLKNYDIEDALIAIKEIKTGGSKCTIYKAMLEVLHGLNTSDFKLVLNTCKKTLDYLKDKKGIYSSHHLFFWMNIGKAHVVKGNYQLAAESFNHSESFIVSKSINQYILQLHKALNALHAGEYQYAYELYLKNRKCRFEVVREQFAIIEAYLCYLSYMGFLKLKHSFRIGKYLNETFKAQTDKEGSNVNIIIAELLVYLGRDRGKFIDRVEAVNNYSYRHLKSNDTKRAKRFIKILCMLPKVNFHPVALQRAAKRHIDFLKKHPISMGQNIAIEILPFDRLLDMIFQQLKRKAA